MQHLLRAACSKWKQKSHGTGVLNGSHWLVYIDVLLSAAASGPVSDILHQRGAPPQERVLPGLSRRHHVSLSHLRWSGAGQLFPLHPGPADCAGRGMHMLGRTGEYTASTSSGMGCHRAAVTASQHAHLAVMCAFLNDQRDARPACCRQPRCIDEQLCERLATRSPSSSLGYAHAVAMAQAKYMHIG